MALDLIFLVEPKKEFQSSSWLTEIETKNPEKDGNSQDKCT